MKKEIAMNKNTREAAPGDGLRSLRSTMLFRAVNYELYVRPVRLINAITLKQCFFEILFAE